MKKLLALLGTIALASTAVVSTVLYSNNSSSDKVSVLEKQLKDALELIKNLKTQIQIKDSQINKLEEGKNQLQSELKKEQKKTEELTIEITEKVKLIEQLQHENYSLQEKLNNEIAKNNHLNDEIKKLNKLLEEKDSELSVKNETINQLCEEKKSLQNQLEKEIAENDHLTNKVKELQATLDNLDSEISNNKQIINKLNHEKILLQEKLDFELTKNGNSASQIKKLNLDIEKLNNKISRLQDELETAKSDLEAETIAFNNLKIEFQNLKDKYSKLEIERNNLQDQLKEQNEKLKKLEEDNKKLTKEKDEILLNWADYIFSNELTKKFDGMQLNDDDISGFLKSIKFEIPKIRDHIILNMVDYHIQPSIRTNVHLETSKNKVIVQYEITAKGSITITKKVELNYKSKLQDIINDIRKEKKDSNEYFNAYKNYLSYLFSSIAKQSEKIPLVFNPKHPNDDRILDDFMPFFENYYQEIIKQHTELFDLPKESLTPQFDYQYFLIDRQSHIITIKAAKIIIGDTANRQETFVVKEIKIHYKLIA